MVLGYLLIYSSIIHNAVNFIHSTVSDTHLHLVKVKLSLGLSITSCKCILCIIKHHAMEMYRGVEV